MKFLDSWWSWRKKVDENVPFKFGVDADGNYGYYKAGADTLTPFKANDVIARETDDYVVYRIPGMYISVGTSSMKFVGGTNENNVVYLLVFKNPTKYKVSSFNGKKVESAKGMTRCRVASANSGTTPFYGLYTVDPTSAVRSVTISGWGSFTENVYALFMFFANDESGNPVNFDDITLPF